MESILLTSVLASLRAQVELANEMADADAVFPRKKSEIELMRQIDQVTSRPCSCITARLQ